MINGTGHVSLWQSGDEISGMFSFFTLRTEACGLNDTFFVAFSLFIQKDIILLCIYTKKKFNLFEKYYLFKRNKTIILIAFHYIKT